MMDPTEYFFAGCAAVAAVTIIFPYHSIFIAATLFLMGVLTRRVFEQ